VGIKRIECECGNSLDFQNNTNANDDGGKQINNCKEDSKYHKKERKLPQTADFV
jgi:hypothetical protein